MSDDGEPGKVVRLAERRPPVTYSLTVTHHPDDRVEVEVHDVQDDPRSRDEVRRTFARLASRWLTPDDAHALLLALVDARMDEDGRSPDRAKELRALADACGAYEAVMFPISDPST